MKKNPLKHSQPNLKKSQPKTKLTQPETKPTQPQTPPLKNTTFFDHNTLKKQLKADAKALNIPSGAAETFIDETLKAAEKSLKNKKLITENDLKRAIYKELKKYHPDLAFVYQNRDNII